MPAFKDITGMRFGKLTVLRLDRETGKPMRAFCRCDCGNEKSILSGNITRKNKSVKSCGCTPPNPAKGKENPNYKHGHGVRTGTSYGSKTHKVWRGMRYRCNNENCKNYSEYGGRGIKVCQRWDSFENFLEDMGERPEGCSLDRIDNDGDYEPGNCRWASQTQQTRNARSNVMNFYFGELLCVSEASEKFGIDQKVLRARLWRGEDPESAVTRPLHERKTLVKSSKMQGIR